MSPPAVRFFNTLGRRLQNFEPLEPGRVRLYTCGPTVYNHVHVGNLRTFLFEDLLKRALELLGYEVVHVMNLTDVDDKTIRGAAEAGVTLDEFTAPFIESFFSDLDALRVERARHYPRATRHIEGMQRIVAKLLERGHAYLSDGSVWFRIASDDDYGKLSGVRPEEVRQGERVAQDEYEKEDVRDFVLWKGAKPGEPAWDSPWGPGRPGWHIECSAMSAEYLGETFDIHCGGVDNMFPHHENEIAQSESATGEPFVRYWLHAEHLIVDGQKMSKSLGNQYTLKDLLARGLAPRALRFALISVHYRQKLNFTFEGVEAAARSLRRIDEMRFRLRHAGGAESENLELARAIAEQREAFAAALADDLNVSAALAAVFDFVRAANTAIDRGVTAREKDSIEGLVREFDAVLGVMREEDWPLRVSGALHAGRAQVEGVAHSGSSGSGALASGPATVRGTGLVGGPASDGSDEPFPSLEAVQSLIEERDAARARRDFAEADRIRQQLAAQGIVLEDTPQGTRFKRSG